MACGSTMASLALILGLACFRQASAFVAPVRTPAPTAHGASGNMNRLLSRIQPSGAASSRIAHHLSMSKEGSPTDDTRSSKDAHRGASTRLEFGAGLGAAAAAAVALGGRIGNALAEDSTTAGDTATVIVTAAAEEAAPVAAAATTAPAASPPETRPLRDLGFEVPYTGKSVPLSKFLGSRATLVVNPKLDDPEALHQVRYLV